VTARVLLVVALVAPLTAWMSWALTPLYAAPIMIPYGMYVGWAVHCLPSVEVFRMPRFPQLLPTKEPVTA